MRPSSELYSTEKQRSINTAAVEKTHVSHQFPADWRKRKPSTVAKLDISAYETHC
jgi:hypothetical protein